MARPEKKANTTAERVIQIAYIYWAYPTDLQEYRMENWRGALCVLYNGAIAERKETYKVLGKSVTYSDQQNLLPKRKQTDPVLRHIYSQVLQDCLQRVDKAYQMFFDDLKRKKAGCAVKDGYPRMKKVAKYRSFTLPQVWMKDGKQTVEVVKLRCDADSKFGTIILPGIGLLKIRLHRPVPWSTAKTVTVERTPTGQWFVSIAVQKELTPTVPDNGKFTGVDVGLINIIATSDEHYRDHPKYIRQTEGKIKKAQKTLSLKKKGSANCRRQKVKLARLHAKVASQRSDFLHKLSLWLVLSYAYIAFEKLHISAMVKNPHLAKAVMDAGWGNADTVCCLQECNAQGRQRDREGGPVLYESGLLRVRLQSAQDACREDASVS